MQIWTFVAGRVVFEAGHAHEISQGRQGFFVLLAGHGPKNRVSPLPPSSRTRTW